MIGIWIRSLLAHRGAALAATTAGVLIAVALLASLGSFLSSAQASMTARAAASVAVDWQVEVTRGSSASSAQAAIAKSTGVRAALAVGYAQSSGMSATVQGSTQQTGPGVVLGLPSNYSTAFPDEIRYLTGSRSGVLIAQQTASNLHVAPGDTVSIALAGANPVSVTIAGVVDLPQANSLFQIVGAPAQQQPTAPPDNVLLLPPADYQRVASALGSSHPELLSTQVHTALRHSFASDPAVSSIQVAQAAHNLEATLAGSAVVGDNLGAALDSARQDASYATVLFLFLGLPGAVLSGMLTVAVANAGAERRRREQALLRARGASVRLIGRLVAAEALVVGVSGAVLGLLVSAIIGQLAFGSASFGASTATAILWPVGAAAIGILVALLAIVVPAMRNFRGVVVSAARADIAIVRRPLWMRLWLDVVLLVVATAVLLITTQSGYSLVLAPEGVPIIQVNYWAFLGPGLLWVGCGMLVWRLATLMLSRGRHGVARLISPATGTLAVTAAASISRQRGTLARAIVVFALALAFAGSTAVFNSTYQQQAEVDAQLTNGADVTVNEAPGSSTPPSAATGMAATPGVAAVEPLQHRYAYVGNDLQDLFGVRASSIARATTLQDAYFQTGTAGQLMSRLAAQPDAILVSAETVHDFQLTPGETIRLRLQNTITHALLTVPFHYVGVANEFPTAPKDSFFIANSAYVAQKTGDSSVGAFLVKTSGATPDAVAAELKAKLGAGPTVVPIGAARSSVGSSLTSVDLGGLTRVELIFALIIAAGAGALVFALGLAERRRTFAIASVLGANRRQLKGLVLAEAIVVSVFGGIAGVAIGWLLAQMLVLVLNGVFDPPPVGLTVPWAYLAAAILISVGSVFAAATLSARGSSRPAIESLREM